MLREVKNPNRPGYRVIRSTVVLAQHSAALKDIIDKSLRRTLKKVERVNYDFAQLDDEDLEVLYGYFDDKFMKKVKREFMFIPYSGAIRDNHGTVAICNLCGKGDSKDTEDNEDHIRYEFLLTNMVDGTDVWCGSTCIINYGLKVKGAKTAEEAKRLLDQSLREHKRQWMIEEWQATNGDHEKIPEQYQQFRRMPYMLRMHGVLYDNFGELQLAGFDMDATRNAAEDGWKDFRTASHFYQRNGFLTETKMEAWTNAKSILQHVAEMQNVLNVSEGVIDPAERFNSFISVGKERKAARRNG
jgi:hypothetical protein